MSVGLEMKSSICVSVILGFMTNADLQMSNQYDISYLPAFCNSISVVQTCPKLADLGP